MEIYVWLVGVKSDFNPKIAKMTRSIRASKLPNFSYKQHSVDRPSTAAPMQNTKSIYRVKKIYAKRFKVPTAWHGESHIDIAMIG